MIVIVVSYGQYAGAIFYELPYVLGQGVLCKFVPVYLVSPGKSVFVGFLSVPGKSGVLLLPRQGILVT